MSVLIPGNNLEGSYSNSHFIFWKFLIFTIILHLIRECYFQTFSLILKSVLLINTSLGCLSFTVQNNVENLSFRGCFYIHLWKVKSFNFNIFQLISGYLQNLDFLIREKGFLALAVIILTFDMSYNMAGQYPSVLLDSRDADMFPK